MKKDEGWVVWLVMAIPVIWAALLLAGCWQDGMTLLPWLESFMEATEHPFAISLGSKTGPVVLMALACYGAAVAAYYSWKGNRRPGEEYGSAHWGSPQALRKKYQDAKAKLNNIILTQNMQMGLDNQRYRRNLNIVVIGGSGAGKTRFFCKPGIMSANCSYLITDPKGEMLRDTGNLLLQEGYDVKVFNLNDPDNSDCYNPFRYIRDEKDVLRLIDNLIKNTTAKNATSSDPFWEKSEVALDSALMLYLLSEAPPEEQNFSTLMYLLENAAVKEEDEEYQSPVDKLFEELEEKNPDHVAVKEWKVFKHAAGNTAKSIIVSAAVRLAAFNLPQIARMTSRDELDLGSLGERKRAIFCVIPDNDASMNYLVGMLYTQAFQELYYRADNLHDGALPVPVRCIQDEWANVAQPDSYPKILATCRSRRIFLNIIVQNIASIKAQYKDEWEGIMGNCDVLLYLGGNEQSTHEYISKLLGKETLDTRTYGTTRGRSGSSSTNYQNTGRELLTSDEVRMLDDNDALLFIRGERPIRDKKYDIMKHPNIKKSRDGGAPAYVHKREVPDYRLPDLPYGEEDLDYITILDDPDDEEEEDFFQEENKEEEYDEE